MNESINSQNVHLSIFLSFYINHEGFHFTDIFFCQHFLVIHKFKHATQSITSDRIPESSVPCTMCGSDVTWRWCQFFSRRGHTKFVFVHIAFVSLSILLNLNAKFEYELIGESRDDVVNGNKHSIIHRVRFVWHGWKALNRKSYVNRVRALYKYCYTMRMDVHELYTLSIMYIVHMIDSIKQMLFIQWFVVFCVCLQIVALRVQCSFFSTCVSTI